MSQLRRAQYDSIADGYSSLNHPSFQLELELVSKAIGDCTALKMLDLGGGTGTYALRAVDKGAELVDVVDNSLSMLEKGREIAMSRESKGKLRWFEGNAAETLHNLPLLLEGYDVLMCNWVFNHAATDEELESMWRTASSYLKPGGKLVNIRATGPFDVDYATTGKYGITISELTTIPNGVKFKVHMHINPPIEFEGTCLDGIGNLSDDINHRHSFGDKQVLRPQDAEIVRKDEQFWADFVK